MSAAGGEVALGILISGRGSNMQALIAACADPAYPARVAVVIANNPDAAGLVTAREAGIDTAVIDHHAYTDRAAFEAALDRALDAAGVELVCLAGFMRVLGADFVERRAGRIINIHPSLLPDYKGLHTHARALADGRRRAGCSVHFVTAGLDDGPVIAQESVPILPGDTPEILAARILPVEHRLYPAAVAQVAAKIIEARPGISKL